MITDNKFLDSLSSDLVNAISQKSIRVSLKPGVRLSIAATRPGHIYFLTEGFASLIVGTAEGATAEFGMMGPESIIGAHGLFGGESGRADCVVQHPATAWRMDLPTALALFRNSEEFHTRVLAYVQTEAAIMAQLAACNALHEAQGRLARWLLMASDRIGEGAITVTQQTMADLLGVRRTTMTGAANLLREQGSIRHTRGRIYISDLPKLRRVACSCYAEICRLQSGASPARTSTMPPQEDAQRVDRFREESASVPRFYSPAASLKSMAHPDQAT